MKNSIDIETVLRELYTVSGCRVSIHDSEYVEIAAYPHELTSFCRLAQTSPSAYLDCLRGDAEALARVRRTEEPYIYRCRLGLYEAVAPLYQAGVLTGYLMMGQVADSDRDEKENIFQKVKLCFENGKLDRDAMRWAISELPTTTAERFSSFVGIMTICAEYITLSGRMNLPVRDLAHMVKKYIHQNYARHFCLDDLCENFRCSKSTLMNSFREAYGTTINRYVTEVRVSRAKRMLADTDTSVREIAAECGFADQGYFTKVFVAAAGMAPTEYRRRAREGGVEAASDDFELYLP